jgi:hypothetical protein
MPDTWRLMHAASRFKAHLTHPLIFKSDPSLEDVNHLKAHLMMVPGGLSMGARFGLDHMRNRCTRSSLPDTQVLIKEKGPQPVGLKARSPACTTLNCMRFSVMSSLSF